MKHRSVFPVFSAILFSLFLAAGVLMQAGAAQAARKGASTVEISGVVNINTASQTKLCMLPGIGQKKAQAIIEQRAKKPFGQPAELLQIKGISQKLFSRIKNFVVTAGDTTLVRRRIPAPAQN